MDESSARAILTWRYDTPYNIYDPDSGKSADSLSYFLNPQRNFYSISDEYGDLIAYCSFGTDGQVPGGDYSADALDIGVGVRPDLTGQGCGLKIVNTVLEFARGTFAPAAFRVTVAEFNTRALWVWGSAGFRAVQTFTREGDNRAFAVLTRGA